MQHLKFYTAALILTAALTGAFCVRASDTRYFTDSSISAFVDGSPIESYNLDGYTYVKVNSLASYGFDIEWNGGERTLNVSRDAYSFTPFVADFVNVKKTNAAPSAVAEINPTDIKVALDGVLVDAYNISSSPAAVMVINLAELSRYGNYIYDDAKRRVDIDILNREIENAEEKATRTDNSNEYAVYIVDESEKGIFEDGELIYGVKSKTVTDRHGETKTSEYGNFKENKTVKAVSTYLYADGNTTRYEYALTSPVSYVARGTDGVGYSGYCEGDYTACLESSDDYKYGILLQRIVPNDEYGTQIRYLKDTGELYIVFKKVSGTDDASAASEDGSEDTSAFCGQLFKDGVCVYNGTMRPETFSFDFGSGDNAYVREYTVIYAPQYTDSDGVIYYFDEYSNYPLIDAVYYRGNVVNGVAHGTGKIYAFDASAQPDGAAAIYSLNDDGEAAVDYLPRPEKGVLCDGEFADGLPNGLCTTYESGIPVSSGTWTRGKKNGEFIDCKSISSDAAYISYTGNYADGVRSGCGVEYALNGSTLFERFVGEWENGNWHNGKWYETEYDAESNTLKTYLAYEGEFNYDGPQYGTDYRYYNEETGEYEVKTGWFENWVFLHE